MTDTTKLGRLKYIDNIGRNQLHIVYEKGILLQSYSTIVAAYIGGQLYLAPEHECSNTTNKHVKAFCGLSVADRRKGLENGRILPLEM